MLDVGLYLFVLTRAINSFELKRPFLLETSCVAVIPQGFSMLGGVRQRKLYAQQKVQFDLSNKEALHKLYDMPSLT